MSNVDKIVNKALQSKGTLNKKVSDLSGKVKPYMNKVVSKVVNEKKPRV